MSGGIVLGREAFGEAVKLMLLGASEGGILWADVEKRARACHVLLPLVREMAECGWPSICGLDAEGFGEVRRRVVGEACAREAVWRRSLGVVRGVVSEPFIVLKGVLLGERLFGAGMWRETSDIDIWVPPSSFGRVVLALEGAGYRRCEVRAWATNQMMLVHDFLSPVEVHWSLGRGVVRGPEFVECYERGKDMSGVRVLGDEDMWLLLLMHAHQHLFAVKTMLDLSAAWDGGRIGGGHTLAGLYGYGRLSGWVSGAVGSHFSGYGGYLLGKYFRESMLMKSFGRLLIGEGTFAGACLGVFLRGLSMMCLDGWGVRLGGICHEFFYGPHRVGRFVHCHLLKLGERFDWR